MSFRGEVVSQVDGYVYGKLAKRNNFQREPNLAPQEKKDPSNVCVAS